MSPNPPRSTVAGRVFNDLRALAKREGRSTDELLVLYVLERFLSRVALSPSADRLVLKGGLLLAVLDARRATRDADLLALRQDGGEHRVRALIGEIASIDIDDGVAFDLDRVRSAPTREGAAYGGVRLVVPSALGRARVNLALDVNVGDPVTPGPVPTRFPQMLGGEPFELLGYPVETVLAEKIAAALDLGGLNTRDRDWADVWRLTGAHDLDGDTPVEFSGVDEGRDVGMVELAEGVPFESQPLGRLRARGAAQFERGVAAAAVDEVDVGESPAPERPAHQPAVDVGRHAHRRTPVPSHFRGRHPRPPVPRSHPGRRPAGDPDNRGETADVPRGTA
jgi:hypothetical protein